MLLVKDVLLLLRGASLAASDKRSTYVRIYEDESGAIVLGKGDVILTAFSSIIELENLVKGVDDAESDKAEP